MSYTQPVDSSQLHLRLTFAFGKQEVVQLDFREAETILLNVFGCLNLFFAPFLFIRRKEFDKRVAAQSLPGAKLFSFGEERISRLSAPLCLLWDERVHRGNAGDKEVGEEEKEEEEAFVEAGDGRGDGKKIYDVTAVINSFFS